MSHWRSVSRFVCRCAWRAPIQSPTLQTLSAAATSSTDPSTKSSKRKGVGNVVELAALRIVSGYRDSCKSLVSAWDWTMREEKP